MNIAYNSMIDKAVAEILMGDPLFPGNGLNAFLVKENLEDYLQLEQLRAARIK